MSYIDNNLLASETIIFRTKKHIIIFFYPLVLLLFSVYVTPHLLNNPILARIVLAPWVVTGIFWLAVWLEYITSEFAITDKRVMMREGFFYRHANEVRIATISQVNVSQNLIGQLFGYGTVSINAFGAFDSYDLISKPILFQQFLNAQLDMVTK